MTRGLPAIGCSSHVFHSRRRLTREGCVRGWGTGWREAGLPYVQARIRSDVRVRAQGREKRAGEPERQEPGRNAVVKPAHTPDGGGAGGERQGWGSRIQQHGSRQGIQQRALSGVARGAGASGARSRRIPTARPPASAKAHSAGGRLAATKSRTRNATPSNGPSTGSGVGRWVRRIGAPYRCLQKGYCDNPVVKASHPTRLNGAS